jgi:cold shock CspA family protein
MQPRYTGTIIMWHQACAYGFVKEDTTEETFFVHVSNIRTERQLRIPRLLGVRIEFAIGDPFKIGRSRQAIMIDLLTPPNKGLQTLTASASDIEVGGTLATSQKTEVRQ